MWSASLLSILDKEPRVRGRPCVNRDYGADLSFGDTVHPGRGRPDHRHLHQDTDLTVQVLTDSEQQLVIDQAKAFAFEIDDIDMRQVRAGGALMGEASPPRAFGLRDVAI